MKKEVRHLRVIDRTEADADRVLELSAKGWAAMTAGRPRRAEKRKEEPV